MKMQRSPISAAVIVLAVASSTTAFAATTTGTITSVNQKSDSITLSDGKTFTLPEGIEAETLKPGEKVIVTYTMKKGKAAVSSIRPTQ
jgi:hypothetical protein